MKHLLGTLEAEMSTQKGNATRTRSQKYQNKTKFKNDLHDKSHTIKFVNSLEIDNVCVRCKSIIEWKIKYKKYKPLKSPSTCVKCHNKNVKHAYHTICSDCSTNLKVCPKCGENKELVQSTSNKNLESIMKSSEIQEAAKRLPERKRRTFYRQLNNQSSDIKSEEEVLNKFKELSVNGGGKKDLDDFDFDEDFSDFDSENDSDAD